VNLQPAHRRLEVALDDPAFAPIPNCPHLPASLLTLQPTSEVDAAAGRGELDAATDGEEIKAGREALDTATGLNASTRL
jgi:hypothetical protein